VTLIRERTKNGALLVEFMFNLFQGKPIEGRKPTLRDRRAAADWLAAHGFGRPASAEPPQGEEKPRLAIIFQHPFGYDPLKDGKGSPTRAMDTTARELAPPAEKGTHEVLSGDDL